MNDQHFKLMNTLQNQRDQLALLVTLLAHDEYKALRTEAVDALDKTQHSIQRGMTYRTQIQGKPLRIAENTALIETLNAAVIAMPDAAWRESEGAL